MAFGAARRELRVILSRNRSPAPLRAAKWAWTLGLPLVGMATHLLYHRKTRNWIRPWGGWNDVATAAPNRVRDRLRRHNPPEQVIESGP